MKTLNFLNKEKENLEQKISRTLEKGDIGTYKNLMQAYERVLYLIKEEDVWQEKFSHYHADGKELISTWEQKGEDIRNKKTYEVKEKLNQQDDNKLYFDTELYDNINGFIITNVYYNGEIFKIKSNVAYACEYIEKLIKDKNVQVYGDLHSFGLDISDGLIKKGIKVNETKFNTFDLASRKENQMYMKGRDIFYSN